MTRRRRTPRAELDPAAARYFVYSLLDAEGAPVYIGRSCNVANRIRAHYSDATHPNDPNAAVKAEWLRDVRSLSMVGPFTWGGAVAEERRQIERSQPRGNRDLTARDHRPAVASRSRRAALGIAVAP